MSNQLCQSLETTISIDNKECFFNITVLEKVCQISLLKKNEIHKFKNVFSLERLKKRCEYLPNNLIETCKKLVNSVSLNKIIVKENFTKSYILIKFFFDDNFDEANISNNDKYLEVFLFKTDSKQYDYKIEELKELIENLNYENEKIRNSNNEELQCLERLIEKNLSLKKEYNEINEVLFKKMDHEINTIKEEKEIVSESLVNKFQNLKIDIIKAYSNQRINKENLFQYVPIISYNEKEELFKKWFKCEFELVLAYDSVVDGDESSAFHSKCDGKIQTLVAIETQHGRRFGGYTKLFWDHSENFKTDDETSFIFSLDKKVKIKCSDVENVIYCSNKQGPQFGKGPDIFVCDKFLSNESSSRIKGSYGQNEEFDKKYNTTTYLAGIEFFKLKRMEVYQVIFK